MQGGHGRPPPGWPGNPAQPQQPYGQPQQPQYPQTQPQYPQQPQQPYGQPQQPQYPQTQPQYPQQPQQPQYPQQQQYAQPQQPQQPQYAQPQQPQYGQPQYGQPQQGQGYVPPQGFPPVAPAAVPASLSGPQPVVSRQEIEDIGASLRQDHRGSVPMGTLVWTAWGGAIFIALVVGSTLIEDFFNGPKLAAGSAAIGCLIGAAAMQRRQRWGAIITVIANLALCADAGLTHHGTVAFALLVWIVVLGGLIAPRWDALA